MCSILKEDLCNLKNNIACIIGFLLIQRLIRGISHCRSFLTLFERPGIKVMQRSQIFAFAHLANGGLQSAPHCLLFTTSSPASTTRFNPVGFLLTGKLSEISTLIEIVPAAITVWTINLDCIWSL